MSAYRFCRTDDIGLLVDALNRCWSPYFPDEPPMTAAAFKRSIRDLQVWCSSCMVAFSGRDPVGVLIGAKRSSGTLVHKIAVHPEHSRQGHGRHLLTSLCSKLAILGPPRIVAEVPETLDAACRFFAECGFVEDATLTDYVIGLEGREPQPVDRLVIPITVDDLSANGLLAEDCATTCWERSPETLNARKGDVSGLAVASDERIEACVLYIEDEILALRTFVPDDASRLEQLLRRLHGAGVQTLRFAKVHPSEIAPESLAMLGFRAVGSYRRYAGMAHAH
jgi:GNAT superfamily N-acetyltransferase